MGKVREVKGAGIMGIKNGIIGEIKKMQCPTAQ